VILTELGLDSRRHGEVRQALAAAAQVRTAFAGGCAGGVVFSWTDEWHRGGHDIDDWDFGLVRRDRTPKPALALIRRAFAEVPFPAHSEWPSVSVIVCAHDAEDTLAWCLDGVAELDYPNYEAIVVDDGSTDATAEIARRFGVRVVQVENGGLSAARNTGLAEATGEIAAYLDADARPDPHWLSYLAATFVSTAHAGIGGPNVPPPEEGPVARCVARAPGGPIHVLVSDREAEHIPGCNMAFRRAALAEAGGFDPQFRQAGDDVDICWRLRGAGWTLGFEPAAVVWHRRRPSVRAFWRQQVGYGKAEALLERKWPEKYNRVGNPTWQGRLYGGSAKPRRGRWRVYYGTWGTGLFQSVYERTPGTLSSIPLMPEWYLVVFALAALAGYELAVEPLLVATPGLDVPISLLRSPAACPPLGPPERGPHTLAAPPPRFRTAPAPPGNDLERGMAVDGGAARGGRAPVARRRDRPRPG
jgi:glycosyltransferase involved in cell wall biosynthesis